MTASPRAFLEELYRIAVGAASPARCLPAHLPSPPQGRLVIVAAGKAGASMAATAERHYVDGGRIAAGRLTGLAVTRHGYGTATRLLPVIEAGHPTPDAAGVTATLETLSLVDAAGADDLVLALVSGGASANWIAPAPGVSLAEKQMLTRELLRSGATIVESNTVRKHLSRIKGGRLAERAYPARVVALAISDVPNDDPSVIGSGPTVPDPTTLAQARNVVARYRLQVPLSVTRALEDAANETPKPGNPVFDRTSFTLAAKPSDVLDEAARAVRGAGLDCVLLGANVEGEAREVAAGQARLALELKAQGRRAVILSGGELTVTLRGKGRGGPNQEFALALALGLAAAEGISALAGDTDGTDGGGGAPEDPAGAFVDDTTLERARKAGIDAAAALADNNSTEFFARLGDLLRPGPTLTNVNDFRAILVDTA
jgi:hydroxypyruvate reductase